MSHTTSAASIALALAAVFPFALLANDNVPGESGSTNASHAALSVTTLNMAKERNPERILTEWRSHPAIWNSDIILLQEVAQPAGDRPSIATTLAKDMKRLSLRLPPAPRNGTQTASQSLAGFR